jgi:CPA2 family monovalent cation:H+ antiporter-2
MMCAEAGTQGRRARPSLRSLFEKLLKIAALAAGAVWLATLVPFARLPAWGLVMLGTVLVILTAVFWRRLIRWHSRFELDLRSQLEESPLNGTQSRMHLPQPSGSWNLNLTEVELQDKSIAARMPISRLPLRERFSVTVVSIERQGVVIPNPGADVILYPQDKLLLLGTDENLRAAEQWLSAEQRKVEDEIELTDLGLKPLVVPPTSRHVGKSLGQLAVNSLFGVQVVGIRRGGTQVLSPGHQESFQGGDHLLVLGTTEQVNEMAHWLSN